MSKQYVYKLSVIKSRKDGLFYLRMKGANGEIVMVSEGHKNRFDVVRVGNRILAGKIK